MDEAGFVGAATAGVGSLRALDQAVAQSNTNFATLTRTAGGLIVPMHALAAANGPTASMFLQGTQILPQLAQRFENLTRSTASQASAQNQLGGATKSVTTSLKAMESLFLIFGGQVAPQLTAGVLTLTTSMNALRATAATTGASIASIGVAGLGVVGIMATMSAAVDLARAKLAEGDSETNLMATLRKQAASMASQVRDLFAQGKLGKEEAISLQVQLDKNTIPDLEKALEGVRRRVREVLGPKFDVKAIDQFEAIERRTKADGMKGRERVTAELDIAVIEFTNQIWDIGKAAGKTSGELNALINEFANNLRPKLEEQFLPKAAAATSVNFDTPIRPPNVTSIEKMGFVFSSGMNRSSTDSSRDIATNTRRTYEVLKTIADRAPASNNLSFANQ